jgi:protein-S-isoprenylcysteine O-methyltransferase Ste14
MQDVVTWTCWGVVVALWIVGAFSSRRAASLRQPLGSRELWSVGAAVVSWLIYRVARHQLLRLTTHSWWVEIPGLVLLLASTIFTIWARLSLGAMWSLSPNVLKDHHQLRTEGPYGVTRHPIYTGLLGMLLGTALLNGLGAWIGLPLVGAVVFTTRVPIEEGLMSKTFPDDYEHYRRRVPQLIPGLRRLRQPRKGPAEKNCA